MLEALALKPAFALRRLGEAAEGVETALRAGDIEIARIRAGRDLVSRPTGTSRRTRWRRRRSSPRRRTWWTASWRRSSPTRWVGCRPRGRTAPSTRPTRCGDTGTRATSGSARPPRASTIWRTSCPLVSAPPSSRRARPSSARTEPAPPGSRGRSIAARRARTPAGRWRRWPVPSTSGSRSAARIGSGRARCPASPDAIRRARRVLGAAAGITVVILAGVALLGRTLPVSRGEPA